MTADSSAAQVTADGKPLIEPPQRPPAMAAVVSLPVASHWGAGFLLFACLWMPHITGCDGKVVRPVEVAHQLVRDDQPLTAGVRVWPYLFGLCVAVLLPLTLVIFRERSDGWLALEIATFWIGIWMAAVLDDARSVRWKEAAACLPVFILPTVWYAVSLRRRDWITAWARLSSAIAAVGLLWVFLTNMFYGRILYGLPLAYAALVVLVFAPWMLRSRWRRLLVDRRSAARPIRFQVWHLLAATTLFAAMYVYYRYVPSLFN